MTGVAGSTRQLVEDVTLQLFVGLHRALPLLLRCPVESRIIAIFVMVVALWWFLFIHWAAPVAIHSRVSDIRARRRGARRRFRASLQDIWAGLALGSGTTIARRRGGPLAARRRVAICHDGRRRASAVRALFSGDRSRPRRAKNAMVGVL
jgi:uncharacterized membrane-anchored protein